MKNFIRTSSMLVLAIGVSGCAYFNKEETLLKRAAFDLNCHESQIKASKLGLDTYGAEGCGKRASYIYRGCSFTTCSFVKDGSGAAANMILDDDAAAVRAQQQQQQQMQQQQLQQQQWQSMQRPY